MDVLRIHAKLDNRLTEITQAKPEGFGATQLYFALDSPFSARLLVISNTPLSSQARESLATLSTEAQALYEEALGIVRP